MESCSFIGQRKRNVFRVQIQACQGHAPLLVRRKGGTPNILNQPGICPFTGTGRRMT